MMAARYHNFKLFFCNKLKKQNPIMVLDIFEDNNVWANDSAQGSHPVPHGTSLSFTCDNLKIPILSNHLDRFSK